jgi:hypothetical protein
MPSKPQIESKVAGVNFLCCFLLFSFTFKIVLCIEFFNIVIKFGKHNYLNLNHVIIFPKSRQLKNFLRFFTLLLHLYAILSYFKNALTGLDVF